MYQKQKILRCYFKEEFTKGKGETQRRGRKHESPGVKRQQRQPTKGYPRHKQRR